MLITGFAATMLAATAVPAARTVECATLLIPMAWHDGAQRRDPRPRGLHVEQLWRPRTRCFRLAAR